MKRHNELYDETPQLLPDPAWTMIIKSSSVISILIKQQVNWRTETSGLRAIPESISTSAGFQVVYMSTSALLNVLSNAICSQRRALRVSHFEYTNRRILKAQRVRMTEKFRIRKLTIKRIHKLDEWPHSNASIHQLNRLDRMNVNEFIRWCHSDHLHRIMMTFFIDIRLIQSHRIIHQRTWRKYQWNGRYRLKRVANAVPNYSVLNYRLEAFHNSSLIGHGYQKWLNTSIE